VRGPDEGRELAVGDVGAAEDPDVEKDARAASIDAADVG
jgi:hypothetical protein